MDEINSVTGRTITPIGPAPEDRQRRSQFFVLLAMFSGVLTALRHHDELAVVFYLIGMLGVAAVGLVRRDDSRMTPVQTRWFGLLWILSAALVLMPYVPGAPDIGTARLVGLALSPIPFIAIVVLSRRSVA